MKTFPSFVMIWLAMAAISAAQTIKLPPNPFDATRRRVGEGGSTGGSGVNVTPVPPAATQTIVIQYVTVTAMRTWTNAAGKTMNARLLAYSAPKEGETGPVEVIREGKVRFLMEASKQPVDYALDQLSQVDQIDIKAIAQAAKRGAPPAKGKEAAPMAPGTPPAPTPPPPAPGAPATPTPPLPAP